MLLLKETIDSPGLTTVYEETVKGEKDLYIKGIFAQAELKNRNGRIYPRKTLESAVKKYVDEYVSTRRAISELSHPVDRPVPKPEFASHLITELKMDGNNAMGKARVLNTPNGNIIRGLLDGGVQLGVSTRGLGTLSEKKGVKMVNDDYMITAVDAVIDPSGIDCFVDGVNESVEWLVTDDGQIIESTRRKLKPHMSIQTKIELFEGFLRSIK